MHEAALAIRREALGNEHPDSAQSLSNLALLLAQEVGYRDTLLRQPSLMNLKSTGEVR